jgi:hypothetical protein
MPQTDSYTNSHIKTLEELVDNRPTVHDSLHLRNDRELLGLQDNKLAMEAT